MAARWELAAACPGEWSGLVERCGGRFFHTPPGLMAGAPAGEPVYATLRDGDRILGIAAGVRYACRLSPRPRHAYFPSLPALASGAGPEGSVALLVEALAEQGIVDVVLDSFGATFTPGDACGRPRPPRLEFLVTLEPEADKLLERIGATHRRRARRGARDGWLLRMLQTSEALDLLTAVKDSPRARAAQGSGAAALLPNAAIASSAAEVSGPWGLATFSAWAGSTALAAALVGWGGRRGYYLIGGSTDAGYDASASVWLHWRIMAMLGAAGFLTYNLGGTAASATREGDAEHGLYRFKTDFGAEVVGRHGCRFARPSLHVRAHGILDAVRRAAGR